MLTYSPTKIRTMIETRMKIDDDQDKDGSTP